MKYITDSKAREMIYDNLFNRFIDIHENINTGEFYINIYEDGTYEYIDNSLTDITNNTGKYCFSTCISSDAFSEQLYYMIYKGIDKYEQIIIKLLQSTDLIKTMIECELFIEADFLEGVDNLVTYCLN